MPLFLQIPDTPVELVDSVPSRQQEIEMLKSLPFDELMQRIINSMVTFTINLAIAILVFYVGRLIINKLYTIVKGIFLRRKIDDSLASFVLSMVRIVLYFILIVTVVGILGIETSSFIAIFASAGVAIGMALSGTLQNFAGGVLILLLKPYKVGDYIEAQGYAGTVREIQIFNTLITTPDNKSIIIPNGGLSTGSINNYSRLDYRRVDWIVSISYGDSVEAARKKILEILATDTRVVKNFLEDDREERQKELAEQKKEEAASNPVAMVQTARKRSIFRWFRKKKEAIEQTSDISEPLSLVIEAKAINRAPSVKVNALGESSVDLKVTAWTPTEFYWPLFYDINERIYNELPSAGISFPFPQLDVHTINS